jgi:simple sugar transport system substrate-binding protein
MTVAGLRIVVIVKALGNSWFDRMADGVRKVARADGLNATTLGADDVDPAKQIQLVRDAIEQHPAAIVVVPNSQHSIAEVLAEARRAGIVVVTHESSGQPNADADLEPFDNDAYGRLMMSELAAAMGHSGSYVSFIGGRELKSHVEWIEAAHRLTLDSYPGITRLGEPVETGEHTDVAYEATRQILAAGADVSGFLGGGSTDVIGIARAIREAGLQHRTTVMGTSLPSMAGDDFSDHAIDKIFFWDPGLAGQALVRLAARLATGEHVGGGADLGIAGYEKLGADANDGMTLVGNAWLSADQSSLARYPF